MKKMHSSHRDETIISIYLQQLLSKFSFSTSSCLSIINTIHLCITGIWFLMRLLLVSYFIWRDHMAFLLFLRVLRVISVNYLARENYLSVSHNSNCDFSYDFHLSSRFFHSPFCFFPSSHLFLYFLYSLCWNYLLARYKKRLVVVWKRDILRYLSIFSTS